MSGDETPTPGRTSVEDRAYLFTLHSRFWLAVLLVTVLAVVLFTGIIRGMDVETVSAYASPISGLAAIAIGHLFSHRDGKQSTRLTEPAGSASRPRAARPERATASHAPHNRSPPDHQ
ncbi:hypothetical protein OHV05_33680 [Kitasatospora sp. NBC_00070]|uniref:hypothetical protein n=1 Tax=Kitasatospora sp. NBC_00070 TaxID=2975962 RepID=UPI003243CC26